MFRRRQTLRRWAASLLLLWLFGVGAGVANACLAPQGLRLADPDAGMALPAAHAHHGLTSPGGHHHGGGDARLGGPSGADPAPFSPANANCRDFCDKATHSVTPLKSAMGEVDAHALPPPVAATVLRLPPVQDAPPRLPGPGGSLAPPIPIAFLRLAL